MLLCLPSIPLGVNKFFEFFSSVNFTVLISSTPEKQRWEGTPPQPRSEFERGWRGICHFFFELQFGND